MREEAAWKRLGSEDANSIKHLQTLKNRRGCHPWPPSRTERPSTATTLSNSSPQPPLRFSVSSAASISGRRRVCVVTRAGPPSASTYLFAFLFPLSMLLATILTSIKIDQKLDQDFFEEVIIYAQLIRISTVCRVSDSVW
uniref:Uncharacterized protein n=1 Tax=Kalanchoe fedtschenkoi TaxID=63787 RepID=A0A7N0ZV92_KALFE